MFFPYKKEKKSFENFYPKNAVIIDFKHFSSYQMNPSFPFVFTQKK